ncbi:hypothetical protein CSA_004748 [Cucumis sativus]|uniref:Uncharacterized protein n=1 Tax=Cucumis sativus TaxID=3659 RepID=A0ACB6HC78_CUCSA|nr:hypothetical protein CSA_004748 [Cucumis sativus]
MSASVSKDSGISVASAAIQPPSHPTYDLRGIIKLALAEDSADFGDVTSLATIPSDMLVDAFFLAKEDGIVAGIALADMVFQEVDPSIRVEWSKKMEIIFIKDCNLEKFLDSQRGTWNMSIISHNFGIGKIGPIRVQKREILDEWLWQLGEAANGIRHMTLLVPNVWSGDALCLHGLSAYVRLTLFRPHPTNGPNSVHDINSSSTLQAMADAASPACILETRKTAPGLRLVDKWAVLIGGGQNHRMGLFDMVLIKDNHISAAGGISNAIKSVDLYLQQRELKMNVEFHEVSL